MRLILSKALSVIVPLLWFVPAVCVSQASAYEGLQIEMPASGQVRIENQYGNISAEVWNEKYVSVSALVEGDVVLKRSPVMIENRSQLLLISIVRRLNEPAAVVNLEVKVPQNAKVEVYSGKNPTTLRGLPVSAVVRSTTGDVNVEFRDKANADINARSTTGSVKSELPQFITESGHVLQARLGTGEQTLRINSQSGAITLSAAKDERNSDVAGRRAGDPTEPEPIRKAAGTPAPLSDAQEINEGDIIRVDSQMVSMNVSVIDRNTNRGFAGLIKSDFRLFENGGEQEILQFESSSAPFDLILLIDLSGSTREKVKLIREAAMRFVDAARPFDRIGVITFAGQPSIVSPVTLDRSLLRERISAMATFTMGDTKLYDATDFAANQLLQDAKNSRRTAIVLMSDGLDGTIPGVSGQKGSVLPYADLLNRLQEFDGVLYTLWLNTYYEALNPKDTQPEAFDTGYDRMKEMADVGGGVFYEVERLEDLAGAYERVVADLGTVYSLAYRPTDKARDGKWRAIKVNVGRPNAVARGKRGYYAN